MDSVHSIRRHGHVLSTIQHLSHLLIPAHACPVGPQHNTQPGTPMTMPVMQHPYAQLYRIMYSNTRSKRSRGEISTLTRDPVFSCCKTPRSWSCSFHPVPPPPRREPLPAISPPKHIARCSLYYCHRTLQHRRSLLEAIHIAVVDLPSNFAASDWAAISRHCHC